jgi:hypothetical protein
MSVGMQGLIFLKCIQVGNSILGFFPIAMVNIAFYFATLEDFHIGTLYLGPLNAVSDGSVLIVGTYVLLYFFGPDRLTTPISSANNMTPAFIFSQFFTVWQFISVIIR